MSIKVMTITFSLIDTNTEEDWSTSLDLSTGGLEEVTFETKLDGIEGVEVLTLKFKRVTSQSKEYAAYLRARLLGQPIGK